MLSDIDLPRLVRAILEDAAFVLKKGEPSKWDCWTDAQSRRCGMTLAQAKRSYREAVWWFFEEEDRNCERPFSLRWCVAVMGAEAGVKLNVENIRRRATKAGLRPRGSRA